MKALIWKELRENILWAVLGALALAAAERYAMHYSRYSGEFEFSSNDGMTLCRKQFLLITLFGSAAVGLALGLLQVLPELKRDRWAALLHRPAPAGKVFWGKALAGMLLYFIGVGVPLLFSIYQVAQPGNFHTPFVPGMILPGLADFVGGFSYYFAGLLVALQGGRVILRALPIFAALHVSFFAFNEILFRVAVEASAAMALALCFAGWGAIQARESIRRRPLIARLAFLVVAFYGVCGVGDLLKTIGEMAGHTHTSTFSVWEIIDNGQPARLDYVDDVIVSSTDTHGKPFDNIDYKPDRVRGHEMGMNVASSYIGDSHGWHWPSYPRSYRETFTYLYSLQAFSKNEMWFHLQKANVLVGISMLEKKETSRLGADGFVPPGTPTSPFPEHVYPTGITGDLVLIPWKTHLDFVRLSKKTIQQIPLPESGPIYGHGHAWVSTNEGSINYEGVAMTNGLVVIDVAGHIVADLTYHRDVSRWGRVSMAVLKSKDRFVLHYEPSDWLDYATRKTMPTYVDITDAKGNVLESFTAYPLPANVIAPLWSKFIAARLESPVFFFGEMLYRRIGATLGSKRLGDALGKQLGRDFQATFETGRVLLIVAFVLAIVTFFWARRSQMPRRGVWVWTVGVFVLGLPGFILFCCIGGRPQTVPCPACQRARRIHEEHCAHCGAGWTPPPADGAEIFEPSSAAPLAAQA